MGNVSNSGLIPPDKLSSPLRMSEDPIAASDRTLKDSIIDRSDAMQEIISKRPSFTEKWALLMFLAILAGILAIAWMIKYPDVIETSGSLTSTNFPKEIVVAQEGRLKKIFVGNNMSVKNGDIIGWMESTADYRSVAIIEGQIADCISKLDKAQINDALRCFDNRVDNLGEIQKHYQEFISAVQSYKNYTADGYYARRRKMLETDVGHIEEENKNILREKLLSEQDLNIARETYEMNRRLFEQRAAAEDEFRQAKSAYLGKQLTVAHYSSSLLSNRSSMNDKLKEIDQLKYEFSQQSVAFEQSLQTFASVVEEWRRKYLLLAPIDGKVTYIAPVQENQHISSGKVIGFINPQNNQQIFIEANLQQYNFGKIDTGMQAILRFDAYPYQEFGQSAGTVSYISDIPSDSGFLTMIRLDQGLVTSRGTLIPYKDRLKLQVRIVTRDMRLLERLYQNIFKPNP